MVEIMVLQRKFIYFLCKFQIYKGNLKSDFLIKGNQRENFRFHFRKNFGEKIKGVN